MGNHLFVQGGAGCGFLSPCLRRGEELLRFRKVHAVGEMYCLNRLYRRCTFSTQLSDPILQGSPISDQLIQQGSEAVHVFAL